jgi:hypothetical protein
MACCSAENQPAGGPFSRSKVPVLRPRHGTSEMVVVPGGLSRFTRVARGRSQGEDDALKNCCSLSLWRFSLNCVVDRESRGRVDRRPGVARERTR